MLLHSLLSILYSRLSSSLSYQSLQHLTEQCVFLFVTSCKWKTGSFYKQPARQHRKSSSHSRLITLHNIYLTMLIMITCCFWATMGDVYDPPPPHLFFIKNIICMPQFSQKRLLRPLDDVSSCKKMFRPPGDVSLAARILGKNNVCRAV